MRFNRPEPVLNEKEISEISQMLGICFPQPVRLEYLFSNGGYPTPYIFEDANIDTVVAEFLPLKSLGKSTAVDSYRHLVLKKELVPKHFFPFAIDAGGDYFFVDCSVQEGPVYFYKSDSAKDNRLVKLGVNFDGFWRSLKDEGQ